MDKFKDAEFHKHPKIYLSTVNRLFESWAHKMSVDVMKSKITEQESALAKQAWELKGLKTVVDSLKDKMKGEGGG